MQRTHAAWWFFLRHPPIRSTTVAEGSGVSDLDVRIAGFAWLKRHGAANGDVFPGTLLNQGFAYEGKRITLKGAAGIWF